jgi:hypothetical protein
MLPMEFWLYGMYMPVLLLLLAKPSVFWVWIMYMLLLLGAKALGL